MAATKRQDALRTRPINYRRRKPATPGTGTGVAWVLFLALGLPFVLMAVLTVLARGGIYVSLLSPLWQPWPPDIVKPFLGIAVFAATLAYLAYRGGHRRGFRAGVGVGLAAIRTSEEAKALSKAPVVEPDAPPLPPPPPPEPAEEPTSSGSS